MMVKTRCRLWCPLHIWHVFWHIFWVFCLYLDDNIMTKSMFSPSSDIRIGWSTSTFKTPLLWEIFLNIPFHKISHGFAMYDWSVNTSLSKNPNPIKNPRTVIPEELYLYNHRMSYLLPAEQEVWKNVFFTILLFYWAIFVSWFKVIISVVRVLQYCRFFLR